MGTLTRFSILVFHERCTKGRLSATPCVLHCADVYTGSLALYPDSISNIIIVTCHNVPCFINLCLWILHDDQVLRHLLDSPWQGQQRFEGPSCTDTVEMVIPCTLPAALKNGSGAHSHEALRNGIGTHSCTLVAQSNSSTYRRSRSV